MSSILIKNPLCVATLNDSSEEFSGGHILVENGYVSSIGPGEVTFNAEKVIDAGGMLVIPGLINTHHHFYQTLTRNIPLMQNEELFPWLKHHYEVWRELDAEAFDVSSRIAMLELMQSGVTTSSDHLYLFPEKAGPELIDIEIRAASELGLRFHPTRGSMSLGQSSGGLPPDDVIQEESVIQADVKRLVDRYHDSGPGAMTSIALAPCSPFSVTADLMRWTAKYATENDLKMHTHLAETLDEEQFCMQHFGMRPVDYARSLGWLNGNAWYAHSVHVSDDDIARMGHAGVGISHCPSSNMRLGSGIAPVREMLDARVNVSLAVDGSASNDSSDMLLEMRNAVLLSRMRPQEYWLNAREVLRMATRGGAAVLGRDDIGSLEVGKRADLALFNMNTVQQAGSLSDPIASLVFTTRSGPVDHLIVEGRILIENGHLPQDLEQLTAQHNRISGAILAQAAERTGLDYLQKD